MFPNLEKAEGLCGRSGGGGPGAQHPPLREDASSSPHPTEGWEADHLPPLGCGLGLSPRANQRGAALRRQALFYTCFSCLPLYLCSPEEWKFLLISLMSSSTSNSPCALQIQKAVASLPACPLLGFSAWLFCKSLLLFGIGHHVLPASCAGWDYTSWSPWTLPRNKK